CAGDDEWCVISIRSPLQRAVLAELIGRADLPEQRDRLIAAVSEWTSGLDKTKVATSLQQRGVAAAPMNRAADVVADPQVVFRELF
ncbi:CoA transferase, partial [Mycobacterium sp. ITM-2017-0098]